MATRTAKTEVPETEEAQAGTTAAPAEDKPKSDPDDRYVLDDDDELSADFVTMEDDGSVTVKKDIVRKRIPRGCTEESGIFTYILVASGGTNMSQTQYNGLTYV